MFVADMSMQSKLSLPAALEQHEWNVPDATDASFGILADSKLSWRHKLVVVYAIVLLRRSLAGEHRLALHVASPCWII